MQPATSNPQTGTVRLKSGRVSRGTKIVTETKEARRMNDETAYGFQRGFTAWVAAIYTFILLMMGSASLLVTIMGKPTHMALMVQVAILIAMLIPNLILSSLIWSKVYGNKV